jgi:hypothetical protein
MAGTYTQAAQLLVSVTLDSTSAGKFADDLSSKIAGSVRKALMKINKDVAKDYVDAIKLGLTGVTPYGKTAAKGTSGVGSISPASFDISPLIKCIQKNAVNVRLVDIGSVGAFGTRIKQFMVSGGVSTSVSAKPEKVIENTLKESLKDVGGGGGIDTKLLNAVFKKLTGVLPLVATGMILLSTISWIISQIFAGIENGFKMFKSYTSIGVSTEMATMIGRKRYAITRSGRINVEKMNEVLTQNNYQVVSLIRSYMMFNDTMKDAVENTMDYMRYIMETGKAYSVSEDKLLSFTTTLLRRMWLLKEDAEDFISRVGKALGSLTDSQKDVYDNLQQRITLDYGMLDLGEKGKQILDNLNIAMPALSAITSPETAASLMATLFNSWTSEQGLFNKQLSPLFRRWENTPVPKDRAARDEYEKTVRMQMVTAFYDVTEDVQDLLEDATESFLSAEGTQQYLEKLRTNDPRLRAFGDDQLRQIITFVNGLNKMGRTKEEVIESLEKTMENTRLKEEKNNLLNLTQSPIERLVNIAQSLLQELGEVLVPYIRTISFYINKGIEYIMAFTNMFKSEEEQRKANEDLKTEFAEYTKKEQQERDIKEQSVFASKVKEQYGINIDDIIKGQYNNGKGEKEFESELRTRLTEEFGNEDAGGERRDMIVNELLRIKRANNEKFTKELEKMDNSRSGELPRFDVAKFAVKVGSTVIKKVALKVGEEMSPYSGLGNMNIYDPGWQYGGFSGWNGAFGGFDPQQQQVYVIEPAGGNEDIKRFEETKELQQQQKTEDERERKDTNDREEKRFKNFIDKWVETHNYLKDIINNIKIGSGGISYIYKNN